MQEDTDGTSELLRARGPQQQELGNSSAATTDSTDDNDSSEGKTSGGGYSADCSASDQSSDDTARSAKKLSVNRLDLQQQSSSVEDDEDDEHDDSDQQECEAQRLCEKGRKTNSSGAAGGSHPLHHDRGRRSNHDRRDDRLESDQRQHSRRHTHKPDENRFDIESLLRSTGISDDGQWEMPPGPLPQWNGVRLAHVMDPRFDLSQDNPFHPVRQASLIAQQAALLTTGSDVAGTATQQQQSFNHYLRLLEVCVVEIWY